MNQADDMPEWAKAAIVQLVDRLAIAGKRQFDTQWNTAREAGLALGLRTAIRTISDCWESHGEANPSGEAGARLRELADKLLRMAEEIDPHGG
jgi:hypothetical protein